MKLDRTDQAILAELQRDGRLSNRDLAEKVHLSESACLRRVRTLEEGGVMLTPGVGFGEHGEGYFRLALTVGVPRLQEAVARISNCL